MGSLSGSSGLMFPASGSGGGGGEITFAKLNRDGTKEKRVELNTDKNIPAGWVYLSIYNASLGDITVNGKKINAQGNYNSQSFTDWAAKKVELGPSVAVVSGGNDYVIHVIYPTSSSEDLSSW